MSNMLTFTTKCLSAIGNNNSA